MLGLIKKDFLTLKANIKSMIIIFIIYILLSLQTASNIVIIIPIITIMLLIATFSYDDFNNWNSYAITLPNGRKNVVKAKYISSIILTITLAVIAVAISIGISYAKTNTLNLTKIVPVLTEIILSNTIIISLLYPVVFKFGATNGRIILFAIVFGVLGIGALISQFINFTSIINVINKLANYQFLTVPLFFVVLLSISYLISNKIYQNKEF